MSTCQRVSGFLFIYYYLVLSVNQSNNKDDIPNDVTIEGKGALVSYQILHDKTTNNTKQEELSKTLANSIVFVFDKYGFSTNIQFDDPMDPRYHIINNDGDMVLKYAQYFYEEDETKIINFTVSDLFELEINNYFHNGENYLVKTSTIFVLNNEIEIYYIWSEKISIWDTTTGIVLVVVIILVVLTIIIIAGSCLHCRRRREDFETTLPKSKAHKQRVEEMLRKKAIKKQSRRNLFKITSVSKG